MKKFILLMCLIPCLAFGDLATNIYSATGTHQTAGACVFIQFNLIGFTGTVGGASFSNITTTLPVYSAYQSGSGARLNAINYVVTSGTLIITEVK